MDEEVIYEGKYMFPGQLFFKTPLIDWAESACEQVFTTSSLCEAHSGC